MMYRRVLSGFLPLTPFLFWLSCAVSPDLAVKEPPPADSGPQLALASPSAAADDADKAESAPAVGESSAFPAAPPELFFLPGDIPFLEAGVGVGLVTGERRDRGSSLGEEERAALSESFRAAYIDSLLRGVPLAGVLGGDLVHGWPDTDPSGWVQNWQGSADEANSWGLPRLVLAIRGLRADMDLGRAFIVRGKILDHYGKSAGINGANGDSGYGSPRGYEFYREGKTVQRFDLGLISADAGGNLSFLPEIPPSLAYSFSPEIGVFPEGGPGAPEGEAIRAVFLTAARMAVDRGVEAMVPDGPGERLSFPGGETVEGFYAQSFNERSVALILPDSPRLPPFPRFVASPYLDALLAPNQAVPGSEGLPVPAAEPGGGDFARSLMRGFARYGVPLTDPMPFKGEDGLWREAQRFSRGWLARRLPAETDVSAWPAGD